MTNLTQGLKACTKIEEDYRRGEFTLGEALHELVWADAPLQVRLDFIDQIAARMIEEEARDEHYYRTGQDDCPDDYYEEEEDQDAHVGSYHDWRRTADQNYHLETKRLYELWQRVAVNAKAKMENLHQWPIFRKEG